jgi:hypothetical protein
MYLSYSRQLPNKITHQPWLCPSLEVCTLQLNRQAGRQAGRLAGRRWRAGQIPKLPMFIQGR